MQSYFNNASLSDCSITTTGGSLPGHLLVLVTNSGYFAGAAAAAGRTPTFNLSDLESSSSILAVCSFLYGCPIDLPEKSIEQLCSLFRVASFLDVPRLVEQISDFMYGSLSTSNSCHFLSLADGKEFGEAGRLVSDSTCSYLSRNLSSVPPSQILLLGPDRVKTLLLGSELWVRSEFDRYVIARDVLMAHRSSAGANYWGGCRSSVSSSSVASNSTRVSEAGVWDSETVDSAENEVDERDAEEVPPVTTTTPRIAEHFAQATHSSVSSAPMFPPLKMAPVLFSPPSSPVAQLSTEPLDEMEAAMREVFEGLRLHHCSSAEFSRIESDGVVPAPVLALAQERASLMTAKLAAANDADVRRLSELDAIDADLAAISWLPFRFGVEIAGLFEGDIEAEDAPVVTVTSERVFFAGSFWQLDAKRSPASPEAEPSVAIYLRRRPIDSIVAPPFIDTRTRTTLSFSIRLCGAPGSATTNSVCGKSVSGKAFGLIEEASWGWESFIVAANLNVGERPWRDGSTLRFAVSLDLL